MKIKIKKTSERAVMPSYEHPKEDACFDISILIDNSKNIPMIASELGMFDIFAIFIMGGNSVRIAPHESYVFHTGLSFEIPKGYVMRIYDRSSTGIKKRLMLSNGTAIIDSNYRGEVLISMTNTSNNDIIVSDLDRLVQAEIAEVIDVEFEESDSLSETSRGENGIGSTGTK